MSAAAPVINSPCCKKPLDLSQTGEAFCFECHTKYTLVEYPALRAERVVAHALPADAVANDATCFFHAQNQAAAVCLSCGRFLCSVCAVGYGGRTLCPACIAGGKTTPAQSSSTQWNPDGLALLLATVPLLLWPFTLFTAPAALGILVINWKKRMDSPVRRVRWQRWVAGVLALGQVVLWTALLVWVFSVVTSLEHRGVGPERAPIVNPP